MKQGMMRVFGWAMAACILVGLAGCASDGKDDQKENPKARAVLVGRVASVPTGRGFVLIQSYGAWAVPAGAPVFSCGDCQTGEGGEEDAGRLANLLPSGEKMGQFVAADVRSGRVEVGDAVYYRPENKAKRTRSGEMDQQGENEGREGNGSRTNMDSVGKSETEASADENSPENAGNRPVAEADR